MQSDSAHAARERLRRSHRPAPVRFLFIGESPPASGRFFYRRDSGLYRAFLDAFQAVFPSMADEDFLCAFRSLGCYLIDLCPYPVDRLEATARRRACSKSEQSLCRTIAKLQPHSIATVVRSIRGNAERAISLAGWSGPLFDLPYPGRWSHNRQAFQEAFLEKLAPKLPRYIE